MKLGKLIEQTRRFKEELSGDGIIMSLIIRTYNISLGNVSCIHDISKITD